MGSHRLTQHEKKIKKSTGTNRECKHRKLTYVFKIYIYFFKLPNTQEFPNHQNLHFLPQV